MILLTRRTLRSQRRDLTIQIAAREYLNTGRMRCCNRAIFLSGIPKNYLVFACQVLIAVPIASAESS
jgi:hypothetical protein